MTTPRGRTAGVLRVVGGVMLVAGLLGLSLFGLELLDSYGVAMRVLYGAIALLFLGGILYGFGTVRRP